MIFKQLFEEASSSYTYLIADPDTREAILIDPVYETVKRDLQVLQSMQLKLTTTLETHVHADHLTGALQLKQQTGCKIAYPKMLELPCVDIGVQEGQPLCIGQITLHPLYTPGHTDHHHAYLIHTPIQAMAFTGDALLIDACGRTDFQSGDAATLYHSVHDKLFSLPDETWVYPGHDYTGRFISTIAQEKSRNPRLGKNKTKAAFIELMHQLDLPYPRKIDYAVPGNALCGVCPDHLPEKMRKMCTAHDQG